MNDFNIFGDSLKKNQDLRAPDRRIRNFIAVLYSRRRCNRLPIFWHRMQGEKAAELIESETEKKDLEEVTPLEVTPVPLRLELMRENKFEVLDEECTQKEIRVSTVNVGGSQEAGVCVDSLIEEHGCAVGRVTETHCKTEAKIRSRYPQIGAPRSRKNP